MIDLLYTKITQPLPAGLWQKYMDSLPKSLQKENAKFLRWQDRHAHLIGKLLLIEGLRPQGFQADILSQLQYNNYGRPFLNWEMDFNISHSGPYVVCALSKNIRLGIDVEEKTHLDFKDFDNIMTEEQWIHIKESADPLHTFYTYWTIKESVIKADSRGLSIPLLSILVKGNTVECDGQIWYLKILHLGEDVCACLATNAEDFILNLRKIDFLREN